LQKQERRFWIGGPFSASTRDGQEVLSLYGPAQTKPRPIPCRHPPGPHGPAELAQAQCVPHPVAGLRWAGYCAGGPVRSWTGLCGAEQGW